MSWSPDTYERALRFAAAWHAGQQVPGTDLPYLVHVVAVAAEVQRALLAEPREQPGAADLAVVCALLHDTVEDTGCTLADVAAAFGSDVADGVGALTKDPALPKAERMPDSIARLRECPAEVQLVKLADRLVNLGPPPPHWTPDRCRAYLTEAGTIADALGPASPWLLARLQARAAAYPAG